MKLGDTIPDFNAPSTIGPFNLYGYLHNSWAVLFSHPADFTPVCTTELGEVSKLSAEFNKRNVKVVALSVDPVNEHLRWINDINETQKTSVNFPILADPDFEISKKLDFVHPQASDKFTVRSVLIIDPAKKVRLIITYPAATGRNFNEIIRVIDSLQLTDNYKVATPANWLPGQDVVVLPSVKTEEIPGRFPKGFKEIKPYLRCTPDPR
jgi:alkyl hydroperoxide reductase subunit AhpC